MPPGAILDTARAGRAPSSFEWVRAAFGIQIYPTMAVYAATKNAVRTLSEGLRVESDGKYRVTGISPGFVGTNFAESMTDPGIRANIQKQMDEIALEPEAIARAMAFAIEQPDDVDVGDIVVRPTVQG